MAFFVINVKHHLHTNHARHVYQWILVMNQISLLPWRIWGRLRGLTVACWTTDHYHPCSNPGVAMSEGCFIFDFASLSLEVARPI